MSASINWNTDPYYFLTSLAAQLKWWLVLVCMIACIPLSPAQSRKDLEEKRQQLLKEIEVTSKLLKETQQNKAAELDRYIALQNQVMAREKLIQNLQEDLSFVEEQLLRSNTVINSLGDDLHRLEKEYGEMLRSAYRQKIRKTDLLFLLSARNINQAFRRWQYLRQYDRYRKKQADLIVKTKSTLQEKIATLERRKKEKEELLAAEEQQKNLLLQEFDTKNKILNSLKSNESKLLADLKKKQANHERLNKAIENAIREEVARSREQARDASALTASAESPAMKRASGAFQDRRGRLPWPVENSVISSYFGIQPHPTLQNITITNNGIDLLTDKGAKIRAVHPGTVVTRQYIPGHDYMLIIKHGNFYTVYSNLEATYIRKDQKVQIGQPIGQVRQDPKTGKSEVHFEVWRDKERLNPAEWLRRK